MSPARSKALNLVAALIAGATLGLASSAATAADLTGKPDLQAFAADYLVLMQAADNCETQYRGHEATYSATCSAYIDASNKHLHATLALQQVCLADLRAEGDELEGGVNAHRQASPYCAASSRMSGRERFYEVADLLGWPVAPHPSAHP